MDFMESQKIYLTGQPTCGYGMGSDPMAAAALMNNQNGMNNPFAWIVLVAMMRMMYGDNWNNNNDANSQFASLQEQISANQNSTLLMDAIKGNNSAINDLATNLNCDFNALNASITGVQSAVCAVGNQVGMSSLQTINSIQQGNMQLANQLATCCCDIREAVTRGNYDNQIATLNQTNTLQTSLTGIGFNLERGFADSSYRSAEQTCALKQAINENTLAVLGKLDSIEDARKDREISSLTAALTASNSRAERQAELAPIYKALADIQCAQPKTETVLAPSVVGIPSCVAYQYGLYGGVPSLYAGNGSLWG